MRNNAYPWVVAVVIAVLLFVIQRDYLAQFGPPFGTNPNGAYPPLLRTFTPSDVTPSDVSDFGPPMWVEPLPGQKNLYAVGPRGEDGKIVPRYFFARDGSVETYTDENGKPNWRARRGAR